MLLRYRTDANGATALIAGVCNEAGNVFGLMPHPEHAVDALIGSTDGRAVVGGLLEIAPPSPPDVQAGARNAPMPER